MPEFISNSGVYEKPVFGLMPSPQNGCSPGSCMLKTAVTPFALNCLIILYSFMSLSDNRYEPMIESVIQFECSPSMAGCVHLVQSSCLQDLPPQKRQCNLVFSSKFTDFTGDFYITKELERFSLI